VYICQLTAWAAINMDPWYSLYKSFLLLKKVGIEGRSELNINIAIVILLLLR